MTLAEYRQQVRDETPESDIQDLIVTWLRLHRWEVLVLTGNSNIGMLRSLFGQCKPYLPAQLFNQLEIAVNKAATVFQTDGTPDLCALRNGLTVWLEVKTAKGKVKPPQKALHEAMRDKGALVYVVRSLEDVQAIEARLEVVK
jgi:hypothetical protein